MVHTDPRISIEHESWDRMAPCGDGGGEGTGGSGETFNGTV